MKQVVVVTGGSAGVGRATVRLFAQQKAYIGILARNKTRLKQTEKDVEKLGGKAIGIVCDVADPQQIERAAKKIETTFGPIDIWVNNATATVFSPIHKMNAKEFKRVTEVTYLGYVYGTLTALRRMRQRNKGTIVQVGSALSYRSIPLQSAYSAAKYAIRGFTDALRVELLHDKKNIHLTMVQLPALNTPQFSWSRTHVNKHPQPVPPIYQPEVAAEAIVWAAHHKRREVWVGKSALATMAMNKLFPAAVDKYLALTGYQSQFSNKSREQNASGNLYKPVPGKYAAHGVFDKKSRSSSTQFSFEKLPIIHVIADFVFAITTALSMIPKFMSKLTQTR